MNLWQVDNIDGVDFCSDGLNLKSKGAWNGLSDVSISRLSSNVRSLSVGQLDAV